VHHNNIPIYIQQDATLHSLFISGNCSTCYGWYYHSSSGAQTTVSAASGICHTVTATCRYSAITVWQIPDAVHTVVCAPDDGWRYHPKHVEQFLDKINCVTLHLVGCILECQHTFYYESILILSSHTGPHFPNGVFHLCFQPRFLYKCLNPPIESPQPLDTIHG
jgi:hypothetical protein